MQRTTNSLHLRRMRTILVTLLCCQNIQANDSFRMFMFPIAPRQLNIQNTFPDTTYPLREPANFGMTRRDWCYILVELTPGDARTQHLLVDNTSLDSVLIYETDGRSLQAQLYIGGNAITYDRSRRYVWHTAPVVRDSLSPKYYLVCMKAPAQNVNATVQVVSEEFLESNHTRYQRIIFGYAGCVAFILFAALASYFLLHRSVLLTYAGYIIATSAWIFAHYGYTFAFIHPLLPRINMAVKPVASLLAVFFLTKMVLKLIPDAVIYKLIVDILRALQVITISVVVLIVPGVFFRYSVSTMLLLHIAWHVALVGTILALMTILASLFRGHRILKLLTFAIAAPLVMALIQIVINNGHIHSPEVGEHGLVVAQLFQMIALAYVIFYRIWEDQRDKDSAIEELQRQQKQTLQSLISLQDNERKRIAQDLHDSIGPMLAAIKINVNRASGGAKSEEEMEEILGHTHSIIDESIAEIRNISHQLMPKGLSARGLITLLTEYFQDLESLYHLKVEFMHKVEVSLPEDTQLNVYRILCELVLNAAKHSGAKLISVGLQTSTVVCELVVSDNGKGFSVNATAGNVLGLASMQRRVTYLKGNFDIASGERTGTCVKISVPLFIPGPV